MRTDSNHPDMIPSKRFYELAVLMRHNPHRTYAREKVEHLLEHPHAPLPLDSDNQFIAAEVAIFMERFTQ